MVHHNKYFSCSCILLTQYLHLHLKNLMICYLLNLSFFHYNLPPLFHFLIFCNKVTLLTIIMNLAFGDFSLASLSFLFAISNYFCPELNFSSCVFLEICYYSILLLDWTKNLALKGGSFYTINILETLILTYWNMEISLHQYFLISNQT
jgi:hypothetical protein